MAKNAVTFSIKASSLAAFVGALAQFFAAASLAATLAAQKATKPQLYSFNFFTLSNGMDILQISDGRVATFMSHPLSFPVGFNLVMTEDTCRHPPTVPVRCHLTVPYSMNASAFVWTKTPDTSRLYHQIKIGMNSDDNPNDFNTISFFKTSSRFAAIDARDVPKQPATFNCNIYSWLGSPDSTGEYRIPLWTAEDTNQNFDTNGMNDSTDSELENVVLKRVGPGYRFASFANNINVANNTVDPQLPFQGRNNTIVRYDGKQLCQITFSVGFDAATTAIANGNPFGKQYTTPYIPDQTDQNSIKSALQQYLGQKVYLK